MQLKMNTMSNSVRSMNRLKADSKLDLQCGRAITNRISGIELPNTLS